MIYKEPNFICQNKKCTEDTGGCKKDSKIDKNSYNSASLEFGLYCERRAERIYGESMLFLGNLLGLFIFNYISDNYGRLKSLFLSWFLGFIGSLLGNFAYNELYLHIGMLLIGLGMGAFGVISNVYISEISNLKYGSFY
jgi:MFS family permease